MYARDFMRDEMFWHKIKIINNIDIKIFSDLMNFYSNCIHPLDTYMAGISTFSNKPYLIRYT